MKSLIEFFKKYDIEANIYLENDLGCKITFNVIANKAELSHFLVEKGVIESIYSYIALDNLFKKNRNRFRSIKNLPPLLNTITLSFNKHVTELEENNDYVKYSQILYIDKDPIKKDIIIEDIDIIGRLIDEDFPFPQEIKNDPLFKKAFIKRKL